MILRGFMLGAWWLVSQAALGEQNRYQCSYYLFEVPATVNGWSRSPDPYCSQPVSQLDPLQLLQDQALAAIASTSHR
jgi:hypothetical protein